MRMDQGIAALWFYAGLVMCLHKMKDMLSQGLHSFTAFCCKAFASQTA